MAYLSMGVIKIMPQEGKSDERKKEDVSDTFISNQRSSPLESDGSAMKKHTLHSDSDNAHHSLHNNMFAVQNQIQLIETNQFNPLASAERPVLMSKLCNPERTDMYGLKYGQVDRWSSDALKRGEAKTATAACEECSKSLSVFGEAICSNICHVKASSEEAISYLIGGLQVTESQRKSSSEGQLQDIKWSDTEFHQGWGSMLSDGLYTYSSESAISDVYSEEESCSPDEREREYGSPSLYSTRQTPISSCDSAVQSMQSLTVSHGHSRAMFNDYMPLSYSNRILAASSESAIANVYKGSSSSSESAVDNVQEIDLSSVTDLYQRIMSLTEGIDSTIYKVIDESEVPLATGTSNTMEGASDEEGIPTSGRSFGGFGEDSLELSNEKYTNDSGNDVFDIKYSGHVPEVMGHDARKRPEEEPKCGRLSIKDVCIESFDGKHDMVRNDIKCIAQDATTSAHVEISNGSGVPLSGGDEGHATIVRKLHNEDEPSLIEHRTMPVNKAGTSMHVQHETGKCWNIIKVGKITLDRIAFDEPRRPVKSPLLEQDASACAAATAASHVSKQTHASSVVKAENIIPEKLSVESQSQARKDTKGDGNGRTDAMEMETVLPQETMQATQRTINETVKQTQASDKKKMASLSKPLGLSEEELRAIHETTPAKGQLFITHDWLQTYPGGPADKYRQLSTRFQEHLVSACGIADTALVEDPLPVWYNLKGSADLSEASSSTDSSNWGSQETVIENPASTIKFQAASHEQGPNLNAVSVISKASSAPVTPDIEMQRKRLADLLSGKVPVIPVTGPPLFKDRQLSSSPQSQLLRESNVLSDVALTPKVSFGAIGVTTGECRRKQNQPVYPKDGLGSIHLQYTIRQAGEHSEDSVNVGTNVLSSDQRSRLSWDDQGSSPEERLETTEQDSDPEYVRDSPGGSTKDLISFSDDEETSNKRIPDVSAQFQGPENLPALQGFGCNQTMSADDQEEVITNAHRRAEEMRTLFEEQLTVFERLCAMKETFRDILDHPSEIPREECEGDAECDGARRRSSAPDAFAVIEGRSDATLDNTLSSCPVYKSKSWANYENLPDTDV